MIVCVETNFLLELAYEQEGCESCEKLLEWASAGRISLVLPAYSAIEARSAWLLKDKRRRSFHDQLKLEVRDLGRTRSLPEIVSSSGALLSALVDRGQADRANLEKAIAAIESHGELIATTSDTTRQALQFERELAFTPQDAIVYAAVVAYLQVSEAGPKLFVTRNSRDFADPRVEDRLRQLECKLLTRFEDAVGYLGATLDMT